MRVDDCSSLCAPCLVGIWVECRRCHREGSELVAMIRTSKKINEATAIALARGVDPAIIDAVFVLQMTDKVCRELEVIDTWGAVAGALP